MLDRALVQKFWEGIRESNNSQENANRILSPLLDAHPELVHVRFQDYHVTAGASEIYGYPILESVFWINLQLTERLIAMGADVNVNVGNTPLTQAVMMSFAKRGGIGTEIIELLLKSRADPNLPDGYGDTALQLAMRQKEAATTVPLLLRYGADPNQPHLDPNRRHKQGRVPLHFWHQGESYMEVLHVMIAHGADINAADKDGETLLMSAITNGSEAVAEMIRYGANVHAQTRRRWTALHEAAMAYDAEEAEVIVLLLRAGASCHVKENRGYTPLHVAAAFCGIEAAQLLLEAGADINARSRWKETPLTLVDSGKNPFDSTDPSEEEYERMATFLHERGATPTGGNIKRKERSSGEPYC